jgi:antiphage defense system Thoeris ThsB-like protein
MWPEGWRAAMPEWYRERKRRAVFLSFDANDRAYVNAFRSLKKNQYIDLVIRDRSLRRPVPSRRDEVVEREIMKRIHGCSVCVCLIGLETWRSVWVDWEVSISAEQGRGILGIRFSNADRARVPDALRRAGAEILPWLPHDFEDAIERAALKAGY